MFVTLVTWVTCLTLRWFQSICNSSFCVFIIAGSTWNNVLIQSPASLTVTLGQKVTISCRSSDSVNKFVINLMHWYQQKPGKLLIYDEFSWAPGIPTRISGDEAELKRHPHHSSCGSWWCSNLLLSARANVSSHSPLCLSKNLPGLVHTVAPWLRCLSPETSQLGLCWRLVLNNKWSWGHLFPLYIASYN